VTIAKVFRLLRVALGVCACLSACKRSDDAERPRAEATAAPEAAPTAEAATKPWYEGSWRGSYQAERQEVSAGKYDGIPAWASDDGGIATGTGTIELEVSEDQSITGSSTGPLGALTAVGRVDGEHFRVELLPKDRPMGTTLRGQFVLERKGEALEGTLHASSGDSTVVRRAAMKLERRTDG
jgi:hypothetical protein